MRRNRFRAALCLLLVLFCCFSFTETYAADESGQENGFRTDSYSMQYLEITVPDSYIVLTQSTKDLDPDWKTAHIDSPSQMKDQFKTLNVVSAYYDTETNCMINFISKASSAFNVFDISDYDDEKIIEFGKKIAPGSSGDDDSDDSGLSGGNAKVSEVRVSAYKHPDMNMFKIELDFEGDNGDKELIYGTIVNGTLLQFSMDTRHVGNATLRDDVFKEFLSGIKLTRKMTYEEYQANQKKGLIFIGCFFGVGILLMIIFYIISRVNKKKRKLRVAAISENLSAFRKRKQAGEIDLSDVLYEIETEYNKEILQNYCTYNAWFKTIKRDLVMALVYLAFVGTAVYLGSKLVLVVGIAAALVIFYLKYSSSEKYLNNLIKRYDLKKKKSLTAVYRFYGEFFTMSGIDSISEYIYKQVLRVSIYKGYMMLYISEENALLLDIEKVPEDKRQEFVSFIYENAKI